MWGRAAHKVISKSINYKWERYKHDERERERDHHKKGETGQKPNKKKKPIHLKLGF